MNHIDYKRNWTDHKWTVLTINSTIVTIRCNVMTIMNCTDKKKNCNDYKINRTAHKMNRTDYEINHYDHNFVISETLFCTVKTLSIHLYLYAYALDKWGDSAYHIKGLEFLNAIHVTRWVSCQHYELKSSDVEEWCLELFRSNYERHFMWSLIKIKTGT